MTIEFQYEQHTEKHHLATATLSNEFGYDTIQHMYACMTGYGVAFHRISAHKKPNGFTLSAAEADAFVEAWAAFKENTATWLQIEQERKDHAEMLEQERQLAVWKEVEQLAESIPGLEILAREDERYDEDKKEYVPCQVWEVRHEAAGQYDMYNVDDVLAEVKDTIEHYNSRLNDCEEGEKENFKSWHSIAIMNAQKFLATHRAFVAHKTAPLVDVNA
jgi:hypothetical protein